MNSQRKIQTQTKTIAGTQHSSSEDFDDKMGNILVRLIPDSILPPGHLYEKQEGRREGLQRGDLLPAGPPVYLRLVVILEVCFGLTAFAVLAYLSLTQTTIDIKIGINLLPGWACTCLQPKNGNPNPNLSLYIIDSNPTLLRSSYYNDIPSMKD